MNETKNILFIINPISGTGKKKVIENLLLKVIKDKNIHYKIKYTEYPGHAYEIAKDSAEKKMFDIVVAVGGDGSVNEVSKGLIGSDVKMGIIPSGSGNGFARHMGIPLKYDLAIKTVLKGNSVRVDTGLLDNNSFVGIAGVGFDAFISKKFDNANTRGFWTYFKLILMEYLRYEERKYIIEYNDKECSERALIVSFCNSNQWGNNAFVSPHSNIQDGVLRMVFIRKMPLLSVPCFAFRLFNKTVHKSKYFKEVKIKNCKVKQQDKLIHIDGEPIDYNSSFEINISPDSLSVVV